MNPLWKFQVTLSVFLFSVTTILSQNIHLVKDINPGKNSSYMSYPIVYNDLLCFSADDGIPGTSFFTLNKDDSLTSYGFETVKGGFSGTSRIVFNGKLILVGIPGYSYGFELCEFDGVSAPHLVYDINPGSDDSWPDNFYVYQNKLYFNADDGIHGKELWVYDGVNDPQMVMDIQNGSGDSEPGEFVVFNDMLVFPAHTWEHGYELWFIKDTLQPQLLIDLCPGTCSGVSKNLRLMSVIFNGNLFFAGDDRINGNDLYKWDGITPPSLVYDINPGCNISYLGLFVNLINRICFEADDGVHGGELWEYDGISTPRLVYDIIPGVKSGLDGFSFNCTFKSTLYFPGRDSANDSELWAYDGTGVPYKVYDINPSGNSSLYVLFSGIDRFFFSANDGVHGQELWEYDGSGTPSMVYDINPGTNSSGPFSFVLFNSKLYFRARDTIHGEEVWSYSPEVSNVRYEKSQSIEIYPNPSDGNFTIDFNQEYLVPGELEISDFAGRIVYSLSHIADKKICLNLSGLPKGLYMVKLKTPHLISNKKVIVK